MPERHVVIPVFVPHKGCPHNCIFCNQRKISGQMDEATVDGMRQTIDAHLKSIEHDTYVEIGFYGGSFTGIEKSKQLEFLEAADEYVSDGRVRSIRLSTRPDYINHEILEYLKYYHVKTIELGVQSLDDAVLRASCRGHGAEDVFTSSRLIKEFGFNLGIQTMVGLPCDTHEKDLYTAEKVIALSPALVRIYPVLVIRGTYLEKMLQDGSYKPPGLQDTVDICSQLLEMYENNQIRVIRIGLQPSENINEGADVIAGPFHPAFRQLVEARLALKQVEESIIKQGLACSQEIVIRTGSANISNVIGQKKGNIQYLKEKYGFRDIKVEGSGEYSREVFVCAR